MDDGLTKYMFEIVGALIVALWATVTASFGHRINKLEEFVISNRRQIQSVDDDLKDKIDLKFRELDKRLEYRRLETKQDVIALRKEMQRGHSEILKELKSHRD